MDSMKNEKWYPLETSAQIYPAIISPRQPSVFRLSCTFDEEIDPEILQTALNVAQWTLLGLSAVALALLLLDIYGKKKPAKAK